MKHHKAIQVMLGHELEVILFSIPILIMDFPNLYTIVLTSSSLAFLVLETLVMNRILTLRTLHQIKEE